MTDTTDRGKLLGQLKLTYICNVYESDVDGDTLELAAAILKEVLTEGGPIEFQALQAGESVDVEVLSGGSNES